MIKIERILCPTDLSTESDEALRYAIALARAYEAKLFLLHCSQAKSNGHETEIKTTGAQIVGVFAESIAPHLGLADLCDLDLEGLVVNEVENVGNAIVQEVVKNNMI